MRCALIEFVNFIDFFASIEKKTRKKKKRTSHSISFARLFFIVYKSTKSNIYKLTVKNCFLEDILFSTFEFYVFLFATKKI